MKKYIFTNVNDLSRNIASGFKEFEKAHVKGHTRTTKSGKQVQVRDYSDSREQHKHPQYRKWAKDSGLDPDHSDNLEKWKETSQGKTFSDKMKMKADRKRRVDSKEKEKNKNKKTDYKEINRIGVEADDHVRINGNTHHINDLGKKTIGKLKKYASDNERLHADSIHRMLNKHGHYK